ncbi:MAG: hypothetical protein RIM99_18150 [Cyclobacteriaceae bacterium]
MQVKNITSIDAGKTRKQILTWIRLGITLVCLTFMYYQLQERNLFEGKINLPDWFYPALFLQVPLMILNWYLEIFRWKISLEPFESIRFNDAAADVLGGLAMNWIGPFTTGDFLIRLASKKDKYKATSAILLNRSIMLILTLLVGLYGIVIYMEYSISLTVVSIAVLAVISLLFMLKKILVKFVSYFYELKRRLLFKIIAVSLVRYVVFLIQFFVLFKIVLPELSATLIIAGVGWIFFIRTAVPTLFGGLGLREVSAFFFFENLVPDIQLVIYPVFILWIINTVLPSIIGVVLIWNLRIKIA